MVKWPFYRRQSLLIHMPCLYPYTHIESTLHPYMLKVVPVARQIPQCYRKKSLHSADSDPVFKDLDQVTKLISQYTYNELGACTSIIVVLIRTWQSHLN